MLSFIFILQLTPVKSQRERFNLGLIAGINFSELEGNGITDYFGVNTGLIGTARITEHSQIGLELLFSQNGEYILPQYYPSTQYGQIWLNHIEIPLHFGWLINVHRKEKIHSWHINTGMAYTRLLNYRVKDIEGKDVTNDIIYKKRDAYLLQVGTTYYFTKRIGLNLKASLPMRIEGLSWTLCARMIYMLR